MKNERHSEAAKRLNRAKELFEVYQSKLATAKYNLLMSFCDPYERHLIRDYQIEIEDCRFMISKLQKEIREWKEEIYIAQKEFSHGSKNTIPDNCELLKDGDTYIVKEKSDKPRSWEEFCERYPLHENEVYIDDNGNIILNIICAGKKRNTPNWIVNEQEAEAFLALMQLRQLRKAWIGDWKVEDATLFSCIKHHPARGLYVLHQGNIINNMSFPTSEMAREFLNCFKDLCETAKILL